MNLQISNHWEKSKGTLVNILFDNVKKSKGTRYVYKKCLFSLIKLEKLKISLNTPPEKIKKVVSGGYLEVK